jgi:hypothetical protein
MKSSNVLRHILLITLFFSLFTSICFGQKDKKDLESQRKALEAQIKSTSEILEKTQKNKNKSLSQLKALEAQIKRQGSIAQHDQPGNQSGRSANFGQVKIKKEAEQDILDYESRLSYALRTAYIRSQLQPDWIYR